MSKKSKGRRTINTLSGTIFDASRRDDPIARQRRCGLFVLHGINPGAVSAQDAFVEHIEGNKVRVHYQAVYVPDSTPVKGHLLPIPAGLWCEADGANRGHTVKRVHSFDAFESEVLA